MKESVNDQALQSFLDLWPKAIMALCVWREARGEPMEAKIGVAEVVRNRAAASGKPFDEEVLKPKQFSAFNAGDPNAVKFPHRGTLDWKAFEDCCLAVETALAGSSVVAGATHYHDMSLKTPPSWARKMKYVRTIGRIKFYC